MRKYMKLLALVLAGSLAACGGGGGSPGATNAGGGTGGTGGGGAPTEPAVSSLIYQLDKNSITNSGSDSALMKITALDSANNPVQGVRVSVSVDSGIYTPLSTGTDASGQVSGNVTIGGSKANRDIRVTMSAGGQTANASVSVIGSQITLTPAPTAPSPGASVTLAVKTLDVNNNPIPNATVQLVGTLGFNQTVVTDNAGNLSVTRNAPSAEGVYSIIATGLGVSTRRDVQVFSGGAPDAVGPISAASLSIVPTTIKPNITGSVANRATLRALFQNASNQAIPNVRVRFDIVPPALGSGEQISTGTSIIYSDGRGEATSDYIPGTRSSPTNGVVIRACYSLDDAGLANGGCPQNQTATLTIASDPLSITLGDNNLLEKGGNSLTYIKKFDVAVADSAGNAVAGAVVSASVDLLQYAKGTFFDVNDEMAVDTRTFCLNEDTNRNGSVDTGEDINRNGTLEPRKADVILSFASGNTTGTNGRLTIQVEYPQNVATWLYYSVKVTTNAAGSEGSVAKNYVTSFVEGDEENGSFLVAPYGRQPSCTDPN